MEKGLKGLLLPVEELDVVNEKDVHAAILGIELLVASSADRADEVVGKLLGSDIEDFGPSSPTGVADCVEKMSLAQANVRVDKKRIVGIAWRLSHSLSSTEGQLVTGVNDEA